MFLAIAKYAIKGPLHAATSVGILAILSLIIPLVSILSGAVVSLVVLTQGLISGARVIAISIAGISLVIYLVLQSPWMGLMIGLVQWLPLMIMAEILRRSRSLSLTLLGGMGMALLTVVLQYLLWADADQVWFDSLRMLFGDMQQQSGIDAAQIEASIQNLAHWMSMLLVATMFLTFVSILMLGRWFQTRLFEGQSFREEFYAIRLGKTPAIATIAITLGGALIQLDMLIALAMVMLATFLFQGLAIVHGWCLHHRKPALLVVIYVMMPIFPQVAGFVALLGAIDNWLDFRAKFKSAPVNTDD